MRESFMSAGTDGIGPKTGSADIIFQEGGYFEH
jgi:hypothetical protein